MTIGPATATTFRVPALGRGMTGPAAPETMPFPFRESMRRRETQPRGTVWGYIVDCWVGDR